MIKFIYYNKKKKKKKKRYYNILLFKNNNNNNKDNNKYDDNDNNKLALFGERSTLTPKRYVKESNESLTHLRERLETLLLFTLISPSI